MPSLSPLLTILTRAAEKASKSLLRDFGEVEQLQVSVKGPGDFVSAADRRSEEILYAELSKARPDYAFLMEESGAKGPANAEYRFIIDPLDGTTNFLHGIPHWAICIGVEKNKEVIAGVVFDPVKNEMFYGEKGSGAFMNDRRIRVSGRKDLEMVIIGGPDQAPSQGPRFPEQYRQIIEKCAAYRVLGSAALDLCYVAAGRLDGTFFPVINAWDVGAAIPIIKESGGQVQGITDHTNPLSDGGIIATNAHLMPPLRSLLGL